MSEVASQVPSQDSLAGLLLPLADRQLLVPNVAVAELIAYQAPRTAEGLPAWYLGQVAWRDLRLPLLSFEAACDAAVPSGGSPRIAVLNALGGRDRVKFIALLVQGIPRSVRVGRDLPRLDVPLAALELDAVRVGEQEARIPDLIALENRLAGIGLF